MLTREQLAANLESVEAKLASACSAAGRARASVTLVAVSKLHPPEVIRLAHELGLREFGENYAQELRDKHVGLAELRGLVWHAIGPVQTKNAKYIAKAASVFHALENLEVAEELHRRRTGTALPCFVEVNVAGEASKAGIAPSDVAAFVEKVRAYSQLRIEGLTAMPPLTEDAERNRVHFRTVAQLAKSLGLEKLSMGTTADFHVAIQEGATHVRVGTALFGERTK